MVAYGVSGVVSGTSERSKALSTSADIDVAKCFEGFDIGLVENFLFGRQILYFGI